MSAPILSVIMPVYQGAKYLRQAIESVLSQKYAAVQLVIVDDGSTDGSQEIATGYAGRDRRVLFSEKEHSGVVDTLNYASDRTGSKYIAVLDQDDVAMPSRFARQVAEMELHPEYGALGTYAISIDENGKPFRFLKRPTIEEGLSYEMMLTANQILDSSGIIRRDIFDRVGRYRELEFRGAEDYDLWLRIAKSSRLQNLPSVLVAIRTHLEQASFASLPDQVTSAALVRARARRTAPDPHAVGSARREIADNQLKLLEELKSLELEEEIFRGYASYALLYARLGRANTANAVLRVVKEYSERKGLRAVLTRVLAEAHYTQLDDLSELSLM